MWQRLKQWSEQSLFKRVLPVFIVALGVGVFVLLMLTRPETVATVEEERLWQVEAITVKRQNLAPTVTLYGKVETAELVKAAAPKKSRVAEVLVREGERVNPGQLLLRLDPGDFKPYLTRTKAKVEELKAQIQSEKIQYQADKQSIRHEQQVLALLQTALKRAQRLLKKKLGSKATLDQAQEAVNRQYLVLINRKRAVADHQARLLQLQARLESAVADVELAELDWLRSRIVASFFGIVASVDVTQGDPVKDSQVLLSFYPFNGLEVRAKIPASYQAEIQNALNAGQILTAQGDAASGKFSLQLTRLAGKADARGIDGLFSVQTAGDQLHLGEVVALQLSRPLQQNVVLIPQTAMYDNQRIYRISSSNRLQALQVEQKGYFGDDILVYSPDLHNGDKILTTFLPVAVDGLKVQLN
ncbi:efflux RND transporter periplasmic adaptor subunit [methane-oxidizing endosymbiont of Gigantopelta aegis]|uniref:efflux RND transporter periplasmic adaptor subunit n=1 Tax=methane-oxidizing endosymbiont of Gigantopelta aegis TaxID=2794938 RepID=UPI0018DE4855|nr:HlyD family efflux transporter periplasmic adaptor subunit [methane-oxidizing endosymbiont of Gigantopelta aegis]